MVHKIVFLPTTLEYISHASAISSQDIYFISIFNQNQNYIR